MLIRLAATNHSIAQHTAPGVPGGGWPRDPSSDVRFCGRYWGKADMLFCSAHVRF